MLERGGSQAAARSESPAPGQPARQGAPAVPASTGVTWLDRAWSAARSPWGAAALAALGIGCLRAWLGWALGALRDVSAMPAWAGVPVREAFDLGTLAGAALCVALVYRLRSVSERGPLVGWSLALACLGTAALALAQSGASAPAWALVPAMALCSASYEALLLSWVERLAAASPEKALMACAGSYAAGSLAWAYLQTMPVLPAALAALCALPASLALLVCFYQGAGREHEFARPTGLARHWKVVAWFGVFGMAYGIGSSMTDLGYSTAAAKLGTSAPFALLVLTRLLGRDRFDFSSIYRLSLGVMAAGFVVALLNSSNAVLMQVLFSASQALVTTIAVTFACGMARLQRCSAAALFGAMTFLWHALAWLASELGGALAARGAGLAASPVALSAAALMLLLLAALVLFREVDFVANFRAIQSDDDGRRLERACESLAARGGLTPREADVMALFLRGMSQAEVSERLFIAPGTVRAHANHIYAKLGVHSAAELRELLDEELAEGSGAGEL